MCVWDDDLVMYTYSVYGASQSIHIAGTLIHFATRFRIYRLMQLWGHVAQRAGCDQLVSCGAVLGLNVKTGRKPKVR